MAASSDHVRVFACPEDVQGANAEVSSKSRTPAGTPSHWADARGGAFLNPWPSFHSPSFREFVNVFRGMITNSPAVPKDVAERIPMVKPTWGARESEEKIKATWLGHACFLVELPVRPLADPTLPRPSRGARILFDPVFSERCSPSQLMGPSRFTKIPCEIEEIPEIDAIVISHNHYDHLDTHTITTLSKRPRPPHIFAPLGNADYFRSIGIPHSRVHILDWWQGQRVEVEVASASSTSGDASDKDATPARLAFDVTCTPAQHRTGRGVCDHFKSLWASWVVQEVSPILEKESAKVYFAGDTGYSAVRSESEEDADLPTCPAFREIGARWGEFDFAMIPIGAYKPRDFMSPIHCAPQDSVRIFRDIRARKALGMHWGTWILTTEDVLDPPIRLAEECKKIGISNDDFGVCDIGQTMFF
ncbi:hypothetical protein M0805_001485 [Coniferiporia weirii]|nr:hypothetical protein M0805_001485 [Coniferiporia weirii]